MGSIFSILCIPTRCLKKHGHQNKLHPNLNVSTFASEKPWCSYKLLENSLKLPPAIINMPALSTFSSKLVLLLTAMAQTSELCSFMSVELLRIVPLAAYLIPESLFIRDSCLMSHLSPAGVDLMKPLQSIMENFPSWNEAINIPFKNKHCQDAISNEG